MTGRAGALVGVAQQHGEPAQVDRDAEHGVERRRPRRAATAPRRRPGAAPGPWRPGRHSRREPGEREQGQSQRAAEQRVRPQQPGVCREACGPGRRRRARRGVAVTTCDHREGDQRRDDVGEQVAAGRRAPSRSSSADSGSTTQPACATVDQASSRTGSSCTSARRCRRSSTPRRGCRCRPAPARLRTDERLQDHDSRAASAATFEVAARKAATGSVAPAYAWGVQTWNGTRLKLEAQPGEQEQRAEQQHDPALRVGERRPATPPRGEDRLAGREQPQGRPEGEQREGHQRGGEQGERAAPGPARRRAGRPARWPGRVASSRQTSQDPRSWAAATPAAPAVAARTSETMHGRPAAQVVAGVARRGQLSSSTTRAEPSAPSWRALASGPAS